MKESRYRNYWYSIVLKMLRRYPGLELDESAQAAIFREAIEKGIAETSRMPDGKLRIKAVEMVYIKCTHSIDGASLEIHASRRTIQRWCSEFVNLVGKYAGF